MSLLNVESYYLQMVIIWLLTLKFVSFYFLFALLLWLRFPTLCSARVLREYTLVLFLILEKNLNFFLVQYNIYYRFAVHSFHYVFIIFLFLASSVIFIMKGYWTLSKSFSPSIWSEYINFSHWCYLYIVLHLTYVYWIILQSLESKQLGHVCDNFNILLNSIYKNIIENFCIYIHQT